MYLPNCSLRVAAYSCGCNAGDVALQTETLASTTPSDTLIDIWCFRTWAGLEFVDFSFNAFCSPKVDGEDETSEAIVNPDAHYIQGKR